MNPLKSQNIVDNLAVAGSIAAEVKSAILAVEVTSVAPITTKNSFLGFLGQQGPIVDSGTAALEEDGNVEIELGGEEASKEWTQCTGEVPRARDT